jgi:hypothetical protein
MNNLKLFASPRTIVVFQLLVWATLPYTIINSGDVRPSSLIRTTKTTTTTLYFSSPRSHKAQNMADDKDTPEVAAITSRIESWLTAHQNKLELDFTGNPIDFKQHSGTLFTGTKPQVGITLGFNDENLTKDASLDKLRSSFNFVVLDRLPIPGLDGVPPQWQIYPQTPMSSFSEGVTLEQYDSNTQILQLNIQTTFFAIYGRVPQEHQMACGPAPKGTYLQVRRDIQGVINLRAKLIFD